MMRMALLAAMIAAVPASASAQGWKPLFNGSDLSGWRGYKGAPAPTKWRVEDGAIVLGAEGGGGDLVTAQEFGDAQLHIEWMTPMPPVGEGQDRSNSGVFFMTKYEVQVLDSWENVTYADGQAGAVYGQYPPLVNASLPPGTWQSYDIVFRRPRFDNAGKVTQPARLTVFHNGVLVQQNVALLGPTSHRVRAPYEAHADRLPISLQDHGHPVRFRNIWIRPLNDRP